MIPTYLEMRNFMCYASANLPFDGVRLACLTGANGHGKSAVLDAMTWALWGKSRTPRDDDLIRLGETDMMVEFQFTLEGNDYRIIRQRQKNGSRGSSSLQFQIRDGDQFRPLTGDTIRHTQDLIIRTLRMEYETFINSAFLVQGRADEFTTKAPAKRKQVLGEILDLSLYDELEDQAKVHIKDLDGRKRGLDAALAQIDGELSHRSEYKAEVEQAELAESRTVGELKVASTKLRRLQEKGTELSLKTETLARLEGELRGRSGELKELRQRMTSFHPEKLQSSRAELETVRVQVAALADRDVDKDAQQRELQDLSSEKASLEGRNVELKKGMASLREEIDLLKEAEARCPLCDGELTKEHQQEILAAKERDGKAKATIYRQNVTKMGKVQEAVVQVKSVLSGIDDDLRKATQLRDQEGKLSSLVVELEGQQERMAEWTERADGLQTTVDELSQGQRQMSAELELLREDALALAGQQRVVDQLDADLSRARLQLGAAQQKLDHCDHLEKQKEEKGIERREASIEMTKYEELKTAFGKRGIQAMIIEATIPEIEEEANRLLGRMTDGMSVRFKSQRETLKGDIRETLDIEVSDELGARDYTLFSGGEAFRINFAIRIAISKLLARRAGAKLQTLIIDEGFGSQDAVGRERLVEAIASVQEDFGRILVITHIDELKDAFPSRIDVFKTPEGSQIAVN